MSVTSEVARGVAAANKTSQNAEVAAQVADPDVSCTVTDAAAAVTATARAPANTESASKEMRSAALNDDVTGIQAAIANGAAVDSVGSAGLTVLYEAASSGQEEVVKCLLYGQANVNFQCPRTKYSPLHAASQQGHMSVVTILLQAGANRGVTNKRGKTPRDIAVQKKRSEVVALLDALHQEEGTCGDGDNTSDTPALVTVPTQLVATIEAKVSEADAARINDEQDKAVSIAAKEAQTAKFAAEEAQTALDQAVTREAEEAQVAAAEEAEAPKLVAEQAEAARAAAMADVEVARIVSERADAAESEEDKASIDAEQQRVEEPAVAMALLAEQVRCPITISPPVYKFHAMVVVRVFVSTIEVHVVIVYG